MNKQIGMVNYKVIELLDLNYKEELPIFLGDSNIEHMKKHSPLLKFVCKYAKNCQIKLTFDRFKYIL